MLGERLRVYIFCQLKLLFVTETLLAYIIADTKINLIQPGDKQLRIFQTMDVLQDENVCFLQGVLGQIFIFQIMIGKMVQPLIRWLAREISCVMVRICAPSW